MRMASEEDRFWAKVNKVNSGCWEWAAATSAGYGRFKVNGRLLLAHRYSYELQYGPIPEGLCILHRCDNPSCVNPEHLFLGTYSDNMVDCVRKGRLPSAKLTNNSVLSIRQSYKNGSLQKDLALKYGVNHTCISQIVTRRIWKHV